MPIEVTYDPSNATLSHAGGSVRLGAGQVKYAFVEFLNRKIKINTTLTCFILFSSWL